MTKYRFIAFVVSSIVTTAWWLIVAAVPWSRNLPPAMRRAVYAPLVWLVTDSILVDVYGLNERAAMYAGFLAAVLFIVPILLVDRMTNAYAAVALMTVITSAEAFAILYVPVDHAGAALYGPAIAVGAGAAVLTVNYQKIEEGGASKCQLATKRALNFITWAVETIYTSYWVALWIAVVSSEGVDYKDLAWKDGQWWYWAIFAALVVVRGAITLLAIR